MKKIFLLIFLFLVSFQIVLGAVSITRINPPSIPENVNCEPIHHWDVIYSEESGVLVNRTSEFTDTATNIQFMTNINDYVYFGIKVQNWIHLHVSLDTFSGNNLNLTYEYNTGDNTWASMTVIDGTTGFTSNGSIMFTEASYPINWAWKKGSQDGSGTEIGDGVDRYYFRIKNRNSAITPPIEKEFGNGILSPNKIYYYRVNGVTSSVMATRQRSGASDEISCSTTTIKRTININWDDDVNTYAYTVSRTPIQGNYNYGTTNSQTKTIDTVSQKVKEGYFVYISQNTNINNWVDDDGLPAFTGKYYSSYGIYYLYMNTPFKSYPKGTIIISGGTSVSPANWDHVYNADVLNGWNTFTHHQMNESFDSQYELWKSHDNIQFEDYFSDHTFLLEHDASIIGTGADEIKLGIEGGGSPEYQMLSGVNQMILVATGTEAYSNTYANLKSYRTIFKESQGYSYSSGPKFYNNCQLYRTFIYLYQNPEFLGSNIILKDVTINGLRYGLTITTTASATIDATDIIIQGSRFINTPSNTAMTYRNFNLRYSDPASVLILNYVYSSVIKFVNPVATFDIDWTRSRYGINDNTQLWVQWELDLKIIDNLNNPIENAIINITMNNGSLVSGSVFLTNATGQINTDISEALYKKDGTFMTDVTEFNPYTITITKTGFQTINFKYNISEQTDWTIPLSKFEYKMIIINNNAGEILSIT